MNKPKPPIPLRSIDIEKLVASEPCDEMRVLGSFWLNSRSSFESRLVKVFKACVPVNDFEPHISALCRFYTKLVIESLPAEKFDWVVRVLGSSEAEMEHTRPQSLLADMLCAATGARNATDVFFRSGARPPMRVVDRLSGPEALKARLQYVAQDIFIRPRELGGSVLLIDDICNTGASTRLYAYALKELAGVRRICEVNLAATRFGRGKDGRGMLSLDTAGLADCPSLGEVWTDDDGIFHTIRDCPSAQKPIASEVRFIAERIASPCPTCVVKEKPARKWWKF